MKSRDRANQSQHDMIAFNAIPQLFKDDTESSMRFKDGLLQSSEGTIDLLEAIEAFPRYISVACMSKFLARVEIFKNILPVHGNIVECGVLHGASLMTWAKLSTIFEPVNHTRRIIGFDTFEGFQAFHEKDAGTPFKPGDLKGLPMERVQAAIDTYDLNRPLAHIQKCELVKGDLKDTARAYVEANPYMTVALLHLDVDLYEPTLAALEAFVPLMPKGAVIIFDEANYKNFPGESRALADYFPLGVRNLRLQRMPFTSMTSYAIIE